MQLRPFTITDLSNLNEIDATIESLEYLHLERSSDGLNWKCTLERRTLRQKLIETNPVTEDLRFTLKQLAGDESEGRCIVAERGKTIVGLCVARHLAEQGLVEIVDLRIDYDHRRGGLGSAMFFDLINYGREHDARAIRVEALSNNVPFNMMLHKFGFELAGVDTHRKSNHDLVQERATIVWYLPLSE